MHPALAAATIGLFGIVENVNTLADISIIVGTVWWLKDQFDQLHHKIDNLPCQRDHACPVKKEKEKL